jgi:hypothetical protein
MLLERLDADRSLAAVRDALAALQILSELLARLSSVPAPAGMRRLSDFGADLLDRVPGALTLVSDRSQHRLIEACASALEEVLSEAGDRLVHEDLVPWLAGRRKDVASAPIDVEDGAVDDWGVQTGLFATRKRHKNTKKTPNCRH